MHAQNTLLKKIVILFIALLLPLLLIGFTALYYGNQILRKQALSSIDSNSTTYISHLDNSMYTIYTTAFNLATQTNLKKFATNHSGLSTYEQGFQANLLREQLSTAQSSLPFCESTHIYFRDLGKIYNSSGYETGSFSELSKEDFSQFKSSVQEKGALHNYDNPLTNQKELSYLLMPSSNASYGISFVLSKEELTQYLEDNIAYPGEKFLFTNERNFLLTNFQSNKRTFYEDFIYKTIKNSDIFLGYPVVKVDTTDYYVFSYELSHTSLRYIRLVPTNAILNSTRILPTFMFVFSIVLSLVCIIFFIAVYKIIHKPYVHLLNAFNGVEQGIFDTKITDFNSPDFAYLYHSFNNMTSKLSRLIEQDYNQKMLLQKAELKQLQAQINPHFLYNSFFMLQRMIKMGLSEESQEMASALGKYFRYLTRNSMDNVTLETEYEHAKTYAYIQGLRFAGRIQIEFEDLPAGFQHLPVPKLILQPLLENAFNYGLTNKMENGLLKVHFLHSEDSLTIIVEDNGEELTDELLQSLEEKLNAAKDTSTDYEMTGLLNIQRRLAIFSDYTYSLNISRSDMGGLCVSICLRD